MAIISITYRCDWPGCEAILACPPHWLADHGWEMRGELLGSDGLPTRVSCRKHRFKTSRELDEAIQQQWDEEAFEAEWGFLL